ncbi:MAG: cysteine hydrolase family protein [Thermoanaerobaculia bacterium]
MAQPAPIEQSALLVVDIQDSFKLGPRWERRNNPDFERNVDRLLQSWRAAGLPVFFILHTDPDPGFERDSPLVKVMDFLSPRETEPVILKDTRNAFTSTDLQKRLDAKGVRRVVVTGISTEQCCETTTRVAADLGYDVDFVTEATRTFPIALPDGGEMSTDEIVLRTEAVLRNRFARIARVDELVEELEKAALPCNG